MAVKSSSEIFMYFCPEGVAIDGESTIELVVPGREKNELLNGFKATKIFEVSEFSFGVGVEKDDENDPQKSMPPEMRDALKNTPGFKWPRMARTKPRTPVNLADSPVNVHEVSFSRSMDTASAALLRHTIQGTYFKKVALVKCKAAGGKAAGEAFLRMDFRGVVLTSASWSNDEPIKETYNFQARAITMRYRPQLDDGSLGAARVGFWSMVPDEHEADLS